MTNFAGTCSSKLQSQTTVGVPGPSDRQLAIAVMLGQHKSAGTKWNDAKLTYVGTTDTVQGQGDQRGYFHNVHTDGDTSYGTFEAKVTTSDMSTTVEGTWRFTGGTGAFAKLSGSGVFKAQMTSATNSEMAWSGAYELA